MIKRLLAAVSAVGVAFAGLVVMAPAADAASRVQITKVYFDVPGSDTPRTNTKLNQEWVRLHNSSGTKIWMTGWTLRDKGSTHVFHFGAHSIGPRATIYVHTGKGSTTSRHRYWGYSNYVWNNTGDTAYLRNSNNTTLDTCKFTSAGYYKIC
ncbi:MAG: lamin tail domain-containing protein [Streptosporangiales bacterium]|nr:lamin tail domain-containing protein [Streptosporangiales bacterium]